MLTAQISAAPSGPAAYGRRLGRSRISRSDIFCAGTALVLVLGFVRPMAAEAPALRAVAETIFTIFAVAAAALMAEQFRQTRRLRKLLLFGALVCLAFSEFVANAVPAALELHSGSGFAAVSPLGQALVAVALLLSARTRSDRLVLRPKRPLLVAALVSVGVCALAEILGWLFRSELVGTPSAGSGLHQAISHPVAFAILVGTAAIFLWSAAEFARRRRIERSHVFSLLAGGTILLAAACAYYLALPRVSPVEVSLSEGLRLCAVALILYAALRRELEIRASATRAAAVAERRRVAQDLHDGLAQDLAFIVAHWGKLCEHLGAEHPVMKAARHALAVSRYTITELSDSSSTSPREAIDAIALELGDRFGIRVVTDVAPDAMLTADIRDQVGRITREAIANAVRHGDAQYVLVALKRTDGGLTLRVVDDGHGIAEQFGEGDEGFGLRSIRDRAAAFGGTLNLCRAVEHGTELEVTFS